VHTATAEPTPLPTVRRIVPESPHRHRASPYAVVTIGWSSGAEGARRCEASAESLDKDGMGLNGEVSPRYAAALRTRRSGFSEAERRPRALRPSR
jgi:hypothetical protein